MKILVISLPDLQKIPIQRYHHLIKEISKKHDVTVLSVNAWWLQEIEESKRFLQNVDYHYITKRRIHPIIQEALIVHHISKIKRSNFDLIINFNTLIATLLVKSFIPTIPLLFDIADELISGILDSPKFPKFMKNALSLKILRLLLSFNVSKATIVTIVSENLKRKYNLPDARLIYNGVRKDLMYSFYTPRRQREADMTLGFVGVVREWVDLHPVFNAISKLKFEYKINFLIIGDGPLIGYYKKLAQKLNIEKNVQFLGFIPHSKIPRYLQSIDIGLIPFNQSEIAIFAFPIKLLEYFSLKKPVISSRLPAIENNFGSTVFYAETNDEYLQILKDVMNNKKLLKKKGVRGYKITKNQYTWEHIGKTLNLVLSKIVQGVKE
ncbi:glycosyltransferase [Thermococcus pacificus]|uniref:Glycosyl transferase family 1 domain-containing protein n=1 Tax=Thermococcus pacificus TaxID=71998 RepID=A0A218P6K9_9EURY|nr:glycosyltransferase [Thermococcus pacificus]ASJ06391.1 hypothetical protein A3L08_03105 [Thermococcus pacificus]